GMKRALFSNEAGQGSAPIAHSAAKTSEPVREGVLAGLEPFIDTIVVCTITALVILSTGAWNRGPEGQMAAAPEVVKTDSGWALGEATLVPKESGAWTEGQRVMVIVSGHDDANTGSNRHSLYGRIHVVGGVAKVAEWTSYSGTEAP